MPISDIGKLCVKKICKFDKYSPAPLDEPTIYPGTHPEFSYLLYDDYVYSLEEQSGETLDGMLSRLEANDIHNRHAVLGYGSNSNPAQLVKKFKKNNKPLIVLFTTLLNYDVVYMSKISRYGVIPAALAKSKGTCVEVCINMLDDEQLSIMNKTEAGYNLELLDIEVELYGNKIIPKYYKAKNLVAGKDGLPIRLKDVSATNSKYLEMTEIQALDYVASKFDFSNGKILANTIWKNRNNDSDKLHEKFNKLLSINTIPTNETS